MDRPALDAWMAYSAEVLAEYEPVPAPLEEQPEEPVEPLPLDNLVPRL